MFSLLYLSKYQLVRCNSKLGASYSFLVIAALGCFIVIGSFCHIYGFRSILTNIS
jgi:hypothetical protein